MSLRAGYAMSDTHVAKGRLRAYGLAVRCPVLNSRNVLPGVRGHAAILRSVCYWRSVCQYKGNVLFCATNSTTTKALYTVPSIPSPAGQAHYLHGAWYVASYGMSGTNTAYCICIACTEYGMLPYLPTKCPVLTPRMLLPGL
eukprot:2762026-Rhodomonas_salina.3